MSKINTVILFVCALLFACHDETVNNQPAPGTQTKTYLVSATQVNEISLSTLKTFAVVGGQSDVANMLKYGIKTFKLVYQTTYNGKAINASGLIYLPSGITTAAPIVSVQHGTNFGKNEAPSVAGSYTGTELFASAGYIAIMPDYIGYGESSQIFHPYYDEEHSAGAVIDMISATKEYLTNQKISFNDKLFLAGYSEGGYVTLAAAKTIDTNPDSDLHITAVAAGAGGYDLVEMLNGVTTGDYYSYPAYLAFVLMSYNNTYGWNKPLSYFFNQPYADSLGKYMNGQYGGSTVNSKLTTSVSKLLDGQFYESLKTTTGELDLKQAVVSNSVSGWKTSLPIRLYHGTEDEIIPYHNSEVTLANFNSMGSTSVTLTLIPDGTHGSSFVPMLKDVIPWFQSLQ